MLREIILTEDGSHSVALTGTNVSFHSKFGAVNEAMHIFIEAGLRSPLTKSSIVSVFEMGFGTGLNALLTLMEAEKNNTTIYYEAIEKFPLEKEIISSLNYCNQLQRNDLQTSFEKLHDCNWSEEISINSKFIFRKINSGIEGFSSEKKFDVIYYDAFDPMYQPELWTQTVFGKLFHLLNKNGIFVTYSAKGNVRRALSDAGFAVEKLPGPKGKREITRAVKF
ncbi:MAG: tRNA (5-methylaminomethyl-2-thiouridine)(34)-methyltransferase MnmD [Bacteroidetes bacterium]|nr:tRNA (5-methylaminomethyl-2-thiouridine)(34)-methyltransferase MnmD [Bacteroidota bacterium]